eukprot:gb/GFBE01055639.1/.p1 GENE.gb/GFBE01055639.1/~~gb/GFBE01055639.1/.p1  ORF type:complete len:108 (+),score=16.53 gb/GFBE01055639.1/:1-324(+)
MAQIHVAISNSSTDDIIMEHNPAQESSKMRKVGPEAVTDAVVGAAAVAAVAAATEVTVAATAAMVVDSVEASAAPALGVPPAPQQPPATQPAAWDAHLDNPSLAANG